MPTSAILPTDTKCEKPMSCSSAQSRTEVISAGLREKGNAAGFRRGVGKAGIERQPWHDQAQAVGANDALARRFRSGIQQLLLERSACGACFTKAGRKNHQAENSGPAALTHDAGDRRRRRADDCQIGRMGQMSDIRVGLDSLHGIALGINRVDHTVETMADQIVQDGVADLPGHLAGADDRNSLRLENLA